MRGQVEIVQQLRWGFRSRLGCWEVGRGTFGRRLSDAGMGFELLTERDVELVELRAGRQSPDGSHLTRRRYSAHMFRSPPACRFGPRNSRTDNSRIHDSFVHRARAERRSSISRSGCPLPCPAGNRYRGGVPCEGWMHGHHTLSIDASVMDGNGAYCLTVSTERALLRKRVLRAALASCPGTQQQEFRCNSPVIRQSVA
jgi:hypothetical protein